MIVVALGVPGSASTWMFNVCRELVSERGETATGFLNSDADFDRAVAAGPPPHIVFKAHALSRAMMERLAELDAKIMVTIRDPRDCVVSLLERFRYPFDRALREVMRSAACVAMVGDRAAGMYRYEDRFWERPGIIDEICAALGLDLPQELRRRVAANNGRDMLEKIIAAVPSLEPSRLAAHDDIVYDKVTHWHPNHLGDGAIGKWSTRLPAPSRDIVAAAFGWFAARGYDLAATRWLPESFSYRARSRMGNGKARLALRVYDRAAIFGPNLFLAPGQWRAVFDLEASAATEVEIGIMIGTVAAASSRILLTPEARTPPALTFDHTDAALRIECRLFLCRPDPLTRMRLFLRDPSAAKRVRFGGIALELRPSGG